MGKITQEYGLSVLGYTQHSVDFLDLYLGIDNRLFLDYNKILNNNSPIYRLMRSDINSFMTSLFDLLVKNRNTGLADLLAGLHESDATHLGLSENEPNGNSVGKELKRQILNNLIFLRRSFLNGVTNINSIYFGIENIGPDRISDIITSIIKNRLIQFTKQQCVKHQIPTSTLPINGIFNATSATWGISFVDLPVFNGKPVIFIPKDIVSTYSGISGTFHTFIRYGFNNFFKTSSDYKALIRGKDGNFDTDLKRKEFDEYNKEHGVNLKTVSQKMMTDLENKFLAEAFLNVRNNVATLTDDEIIAIIESGFRQAN